MNLKSQSSENISAISPRALGLLTSSNLETSKERNKLRSKSKSKKVRNY